MNVVLIAMLVITSIGLIVGVLMQSGRSAGLGAIAGGAEQLFGKGNKLDSFFAKFTTAMAVGYMLFALLLSILQK